MRRVAVVASIGFASLPTGAAGQDLPWSTAPFQSSPDELLSAADRQPVPAGAPAVMLWQDAEYRFDAEGRITARRHWVYRVLDESAIDTWSRSQVRWSPWQQDRPQARVRVVSADGTVHRIGTADYTDRPAPEDGGGRSAERRLLEAKLPGVGVGAVIEEEIVIRDQRPSFAAGSAHRHYVALPIPGLAGRMVLDAPTRVPLRYGVRKLPGVVKETQVLRPGDGSGVKSKRVRLIFQWRDLPVVQPAEEGVPGHRPRFPHIAFSSGRDWPTVAATFGQNVDRAIAGARLDGLSDVRLDPLASVDQRIRAALAWMHARLRPDGFEMAATEPTPRSPDAVLAAGVGDSLDLAVTAVAALRQVGVEARVALVNADFGVDVEPRLPGLGLFDGALVYVPESVRPEGALWIEPSARYARPGELALASQGRFALVTGSPFVGGPVDGGGGLLTTPASEPEDNLALEIREVRFADHGPGRILETCEYHGSAERTQRRITGTLDRDARRRGYQTYVRAFHQAESLGVLQEMDAGDLSGPFRLRLEAIGTARAVTGIDEARVEIPIREMARRLPPVLLESSGPRREEFVFPEPFVTEWRYEIPPPVGFRALPPPPRLERALGPATFSQHFVVGAGGVLVGTLRFDLGQRLLAPSQVDALRDAVLEFLEEPNLVLRFESIAGANLAAGRWQEAFTALHAAVADEPGRAGHRVRLAKALLRVGLAAESVRQARQAVAFAPRWGLAHWTLGQALLHDDFGRPFAPGADVAGARRALDDALRWTPDDRDLALDRARLMAVDDRGVRRAADALGPAIDAFRVLQANGGGSAAEQLEWLRLLRDAELWRELAVSAAELADRVPGADALAVAAKATLGESVTDASAELRGRAVHELIAVREYDAALGVLASGNVAGVPAEWADRLAVIEPFDSAETFQDDPRTPVLGILAAMRHDPPHLDDLSPWLHSDQVDDLGGADLVVLRRIFDRQLPAAWRETVAESNGQPLAASGAGPEPTTRADWVVASADPSLAGAPHLGYRASFDGDSIFVTREGDSLQVVGTQANLDALGDEVRRRFAAGDLPGARRWLDWSRETVEAGDPLTVLWPGEWDDDDPPNADRIQLAIAALPGAPQAALEVLARAPAEPPKRLDGETWSAAVRAAERRALVEAGLGDPSDIEAVARASATASSLRAAGREAFARLAEDDPAGAEARLGPGSPADSIDLRSMESTWLRASAAVRLERGDLDAAQPLILAAIASNGPIAAIEDAFLVGRLAEACGLSSLARDLYARLLADRSVRERQPELRRLTERRLARLVGARVNEP